MWEVAHVASFEDGLEAKGWKDLFEIAFNVFVMRYKDCLDLSFYQNSNRKASSGDVCGLIREFLHVSKTLLLP